MAATSHRNKSTPAPCSAAKMLICRQLASMVWPPNSTLLSSLWKYQAGRRPRGKDGRASFIPVPSRPVPGEDPRCRHLSEQSYECMIRPCERLWASQPAVVCSRQRESRLRSLGGERASQVSSLDFTQAPLWSAASAVSRNQSGASAIYYLRERQAHLMHYRAQYSYGRPPLVGPVAHTD